MDIVLAPAVFDELKRHMNRYERYDLNRLQFTRGEENKMNLPRKNEIDTFTLDSLRKLAQDADASVTDRIYALELLKKLENLYAPVFGVATQAR